MRLDLVRPLAVVLTAALTVGCGYEPPERHALLNHYSTPGSGGVTAAVREFYIVRFPKGLLAFPDGGFPKRLDEGIEVSVCTADRGEFEVIAVVREPVDPGSDPGNGRILDWGRSTLRVRLVSGRESTLVLPPWARDDRRAGGPGQDVVVIPECANALGELRRSNRYPDTTLPTR